MKTPTTLIIMDGYGLGPKGPGNAIDHAVKPNLDKLFAENPCCRLSASGLDVGLPQGQMGNSEVGHTNMGAGRVVFQDLPRISLAIENGSFFENAAYCDAMDACLKQGTALHILGLLSDGGVHSHISHIFALLDMAQKRGLTRVYLHGFLDGRDVPPNSGVEFVRQCAAKCRETGCQLATLSGRYYAMDRDNRWERLSRAYDALVSAKGVTAADPVEAVEASYAAGVTDEFFLPTVFCPEGKIATGDSVIFANFRPDRARELTRALTDPDFKGFRRTWVKVRMVCTTEYDATMKNVAVAYPRQKLDHIFGEYISRLGLTQLRIAETEKYAHVTFFFNGGVEAPFPGEDRVLIPSPKVATYDLQPEMSAAAVADAAVDQIESGKYDVIILNFANCDMVGHTGVYAAAVRAVETVDLCVQRVVDATARMGGVSLITADHGNAECMMEPDGSPFTAHTTSPVPFCAVGADVSLRDGKLCDIAPTLLDIIGLNKPSEMDGTTLIHG